MLALFKPIPAFISTSFKLFILLFLVLYSYRIVFYFLCKTPDATTVDNAEVLHAFLIGMQFDIITSVYALSIPILFLILHQVFKITAFSRLAFVTAFLLFSLLILCSSADIPYFKQFASRLNKQAFLWNNSPAFVAGLIFGNISYYGYLFLFAGLTFFIFKILKRLYSQHAIHTAQQTISSQKIIVFVIILVPLLMLGARGRLSAKSPAHEGLAIVGSNLFVNQLALNPGFTLFKSLLVPAKDYRAPDDIIDCLNFAKKHLQSTDTAFASVNRVQTADSAFHPYNVVIVCMESMSSYKMGIHNSENLTPQLNALIKESVYFDRFFSSGMHTFNGLFSTCAGYPCMLTEQPLMKYTKKPFTTLGNLLQQKNYDTYFFSTHDPAFDNMEGFFKLNGFSNIHSGNELPEEKLLGITGAPDHELFNFFIEKINARKTSQPFLSFIMTGSDHGPWDIPSNIPFKPSADSEEKRATQYADWAIGKFMKDAKQQPWYTNTLFVFLGDHGYYHDGTYEMALSYHHIPFVLHKPSSLLPDTIHNLGAQYDVISTIAGALNLSFTNSSFGVNILKEKHPFVYFTADDKLGCVTDDGYFFFELITQKTKRLLKYQSLDPVDYYHSERSRADSLDRSVRKMMNAAEYLIRKNYFNY